MPWTLALLNIILAVDAPVLHRPGAGHSHAVSIFTFLRQFGICLGVAVGGTEFANVLLHALERRGFAHDVALAVSRNAEANLRLSPLQLPLPAPVFGRRVILRDISGTNAFQ